MKLDRNDEELFMWFIYTNLQPKTHQTHRNGMSNFIARIRQDELLEVFSQPNMLFTNIRLFVRSFIWVE